MVPEEFEEFFDVFCSGLAQFITLNFTQNRNFFAVLSASPIFPILRRWWRSNPPVR
jgi:hypothetical protein